MKTRVVTAPSIKNPIQPSPGFEKKLLSTWKLDILGLCGFGCRYCSTNAGNYLRIRRESLADLAEQQLGVRAYPASDPDLTIEWPDVCDRLDAQIAVRPESWGAGETVVFSMLTDGFSPRLVMSGGTERALRAVLEGTSFRIRVLTKSTIVGSDRWIRFFTDHPGRFVVGLSIGTTDDAWAQRVEIGTSSPTARFRALRRLQDAGIPTYGMLCPVFPDMLGDNGVERLVDQIRPDIVEHIWAEPYNDRVNWQVVRDGYETGSPGYIWMTGAFERRGDAFHTMWSQYATNLYLRLRAIAERDGWLGKLRYLLYENRITPSDAEKLGDLQGVLLQSNPGEDGMSANPAIQRLQKESTPTYLDSPPLPDAGSPRDGSKQSPGAEARQETLALRETSSR
jgi:DNA repair photolyase